MKTITNLSLILQQLCNQSNVTSNRSKSKWQVILTVLVISLLSTQQSKAGYFYEYPNHFTVTGSSCNGYLDIKIIGLNKDGNNDRMEDCTLTYSDDNGLTYKELLNFYVTNQDLEGNVSNKTTGLNFVNGIIVVPTPNFSFTGLQAYLNVKWYYPTSLVGKKNIKFRIEGKWFRNYAASSGLAHDSFTGDYSVNNLPKNFIPVNMPEYNPSPTISLTPYKDGRYIVGWSGATAFVSKFEFYTDAAYTNLAGTAEGTTDSGKDTIKLGGLNANNTYYVKQVYVTPPANVGFSTIYEKKITTTVKNPGYKYPIAVAVNKLLNVNPIKLSFSITEDNSASTQTSKYYVKRNGVLLTPTGFTGKEYSDATVSPWTNYIYVIYSVPDDWADKTIVIPELSSVVVVNTNPKSIDFKNFKFDPIKGTNPYIKISWDKDQWYPVNNTIKLYRKSSITNEFVDLGIQNTATYYNDVSEIVENKYYTYKLEIDQWGTKTSKIDSAIVIDKVIFTKMTATKNTFGDRINLQWTIDRLSLCDRFEIYRSFAVTDANGVESWSNEVLVNQFTAQALVNSWDDRDAAPGTLYKYKIVAVKKTGTTPPIDIKVEVSDIGFRTPVGVVTGRITYGIGTAVQGTSLYVSSSTAGDDKLYKSLKFNGDVAQGGKVNLTKTKHGCIADKGFTFQAWLEPLNRKAETTTIFEVGGEYSIRMNNDYILVLMGATLQQVRSYKLESTIAQNSFFHLTVAYNSDKQLKIFINGEPKDSVVLTNTYTCSFTGTTKCNIANNTVDDVASRLPFNGVIDDVRLWNKGISNYDASDNFNRYLGGTETDLIGYWPMDEGISTYAFDCSKTDKVFNECHITDIKKATSETIVPKKEQLSIKGVTDASGNYIIRGIPFTGDGSTYTITPVMGTHKFEPKQQLRYISPSSLVHNGTDFVDKSSFPVKISVIYKNTNYPVEGVSFSIDDNPVAKENKLVVTNEEGVAEIDVPIGEHYIKASLTGHVFRNNGRFPSLSKVIVDENIRPIHFIDTTLVSVTGKVAGGLVENAKSVGFRKGNANIGPATIILKPVSDKYSLNNTGSTRILPTDAKGKISSISTIGNEIGKDNFVTINTDPSTGEYFVMLPPIKDWTVNSVTIKPNDVSQTMSDKFYNKNVQTNPLMVNYDTMTIAKNKVDSFKYNVKQNFIYKVDPTIRITDIMAKQGAFGDSTYVIQNVDPTKNDTIKLYKTTNGTVKYLLGRSPVGNVNYPNGKPVFTMGEIYTFMIEGYEEYLDNAHVSTLVPLSGAAVTVDNEMGQLFRSQTGSPTDTVTPKHQMQLNDEGYIYYQFLVGLPKITSPEKGSSMVVNINYNNTTTAWKENGKFRGIVMGYEPIAGATFKTRGPGPQIPLVVLRDPPGSKSYAYMEKGTELRYSMSHKHTIQGSFSVEDKLMFGVKTETGAGIGFMVFLSSQSQNNLTIGLSGEYSSFTGNTTENTLTTKERIQTSSSPDFVGSMADVYIGTSTNVFTTECNILDVKINGQDTTIYKYQQEVTDLVASTDFRLSQYEILHAQIPAWQKTIRNLFDAKKSDPRVNVYTAKSNFTVDQIINAMGVDPVVGKMYTIQQGTDKCGDQVDSAFTQIRNWQNLIKQNEQIKYNAKSTSSKNVYEKSNISFDAGTTVERSYTFSTKKGDISGNSSLTQESIEDNFGYDFGGLGMEIKIQEKFGGGRENESSSTTQNSTAFGYVLSDGDTDNRFSVNVYKNKFLSSEVSAIETDTLKAQNADETVGSYIFELAAGQTSCPYEKADSTLFFKDKDNLVQLSSGSQALDVPVMDVLPVKVKTDVPNGKDASFTLLLESGSTGYSPRPYELSVDDATNTDGAIILVDGTPLTEARTFYITKGIPLTKTLTVRQSKPDVLNYDSIKLKFSSACDDITDAKYISVHFVPSCSDLDLVIDSLTMNTGTGNSILLKLRNFNQDYTNFRGIQIQYKLEGEKNWREKIIAKKGVDFKPLIPDDTIPELVSSIDYRLNFKGLDDGRYQVRAMTICANPTSATSPIYNITPEVILVKDMVCPTSMGVPSPSNGILTPEEEIAVTFNEPLQTSRMVEPDFEVLGILNGAKLQHSEGLAFSGSATSAAFTESPISLKNTSFAIEGWVRMSKNSSLGNLFSIGEGANKITLKMSKTSVELYVNDTQVGATESITSKSDWQYVSLNYNANLQQVKVYVINSETTGGQQTKLVNQLSGGINPVGRLTVGSGFSGDIHQAVIWNVNRSLEDLSDMNYAKSGTENNIVGYWPMDEANGKMVTDKVRNRNMIVNSAWFVEPNGVSGEFNGKDASVIINTASIPLKTTDNYSLEFWFNGEAQKEKTIFSCGKGINDINSDDKLSVGFDKTGALNLFTKNVSYVIPNVDVLDTKWHHFALSVSRNSYSNILIDGQQRLQIPSSNISGLASGKMTIGSRSYYDSVLVDNVKDLIFKQDQHFGGMIDEVRIWNTALTSENIRLDMRSKLDTNTTTGLIAYYPFEKEVNADGKLVEFSLQDASVKRAPIGVGPAVVGNSDITPGIKMSRPKVNVKFNYTASDNKIIFTIKEPLKTIENCVLEFGIKKVIDMNGNYLSSPIKWTAYVNNNRLNWETEQISITKEVLEAATFKATIVNKSGKYENYVIDGLPSWLSVNKSSGRLNPLEKAELTFTVDVATNIGSYESRITLTGNNGIQEMLPVALKVTGPRPDWTVNAYGYESTMNVMGQIKLDNVYQEDTEDVLAAFNGTRCVGIANPIFNKKSNNYIVFMDVYGNGTDNGKKLTYSLWDAGTGRIYPNIDVAVDSAKTFIAGSIAGKVLDPIEFVANDKVEQQLSLKQGWTWVSTNVVSASLLDQFKSGLETSGLQIKNKTGYIDYDNGDWLGYIEDINQRTMYLVNASEAKTIKLEGATAKPADLSSKITINKGWSYIGYVPQFVAPVTEALSGLDPKDGDQIKGQIGFATFDNKEWYGSLQYMTPGLGYMYKSAIETSFNYPAQYISQSRMVKQDETVESTKWAVDVNKYQMSMTITGIVSIDGLEVNNIDQQVAVFIGDECRGTAVLKYIENYNRYVAFLMVWGNTDDLNKKIIFRGFNASTNLEISAINESLSFVPDNITGSVSNPYKISFVSSGNATVNDNDLKIYPNPTSNMLYFSYLPTEVQQVEVIDNVGRRLITFVEMNKNSINVGNLLPGIYTLRVKHNGIVSNHLFVKY